MTRSRRLPLLLPGILVVLSMLLGACTGESGQSPSTAPDRGSTSVPSQPPGVTVVAVGDIACAPEDEVTETHCQQLATAKTASNLSPDKVLALGDLQYQSGSREDFLASWAQSWGRFKDVIAPVPGNHEYYTEGAADYLDYFGTANRYIQTLPGWRLYLLDSNCEVVSCDEQAQWLAEDAADHPTECALAAMHHPRFSSGAQHGSQELVQPLWESAVLNGVDVVLAGHDHHYERFDPIDASAEPVDPDAGADGPDAARSFVVGTGGRSLYSVDEPVDGSAYVQNEHFGVLELTLRPGSYDWRFVTTDGETLDSGETDCR